MSEIITDWTFVIRRIRNAPIFLKDDGTVSSALFKDSQGVSVDKDHMRELDDIIIDEERLHNLYYPVEEQEKKPSIKLIALISIDKQTLEEHLVNIIDDPIIPENPHHCLLYRNTNKEDLTHSQARALALSAKFIKKYA